MPVDLRSWWAVTIVLVALLSCLVANAWWTRKSYPGFRRWTVANWLLVLSLLLFNAQSVAPDWTSIVAGNVLLAGGAVLFLEAIRDSIGFAPHVWQVQVAGGLAILGILFFSYVKPSVNDRITVMSAFLAIIAIHCSIVLLQKMPGERSFGMAFTGWLYAVWALILAARAVYFQFAPPLTSLFDPSSINGAFLLATLLGAVCCSVGFVLISDERVVINLTNSENRVSHANEDLLQALNHANSTAEQARAADAAKSDFVATVTHEIRNPLSGIMAVTELLLETDLTTEQREYGEAVRKSVGGLLTIAHDVLDLSTIEAYRVTFDSSAFSLQSVIETVSKTLEPIARRKGVELVVNYPSDIPRLFVGDEGKVRQIIFNLIGNAVKFTSRGDIKIVIQTVAQRVQAADIQISVTDTGIGIPPEVLGSLFERFSPAHVSTARTYGGTGLGLAISKNLIELMGGSIHVESQVGKGSTFRLTLPLGVAQDPGSASFHATS